MKNKFIILVLSAILLLTACGNESVQADAYAPLLVEEMDFLYSFIPSVQIAYATDELVNEFKRIYEFEYSGFGSRVAIWSDVPMLEFALFYLEQGKADDITHDYITEQVAPTLPTTGEVQLSLGDDFGVSVHQYAFVHYYLPGEVLHAVNEIQPGDAFVINNYVSLSSMPHLGISFMDDKGTRRYFTITRDYSGRTDYFLTGFQSITYEYYYMSLDYTTIYVSDEIQITLAHVTDELLARYNDFEAFSYRGRNPREGGIAFIPNISVRNFRYIRINGAEIRFIVEEDLFVLDELHPKKPLLVDWAAMGSGAYGGFAFDDENGTTRYFGFNYCAAGFTAFRWMEFDGGLSLDDFDYSLQNSFNLTIVRVSPEIELFAEWLSHWPHYDDEALKERNDFMQQFDAYTVFDPPYGMLGFWLVISTTSDLQNFRAFTLSLACAGWVSGEEPPPYPDAFYYKGAVLGKLDVLPYGEPVAIPWSPGGVWAHLGISFLDETGQQRNFTIKSNLGLEDYPPVIFEEFVYNEPCANCTNISNA